MKFTVACQVSLRFPIILYRKPTTAKIFIDQPSAHFFYVSKFPNKRPNVIDNTALDATSKSEPTPEVLNVSHTNGVRNIAQKCLNFFHDAWHCSGGRKSGGDPFPRSLPGFRPPWIPRAGNRRETE